MIKLIANYSKRLGLPGYSSHQFSISVEAELNNTDDVQAEASRLYTTLQQSVDNEIQNTGFVPSNGYGEQKEEKRAEWPTIVRNTAPQQQEWKCSPAQRLLIEKIANENNVMSEAESLADEMFSSGLAGLNKMQASSLLQEMIGRWGKKPSRGTVPTGRFNGRPSR
jgi:hypothetical protein